MCDNVILHKVDGSHAVVTNQGELAVIIGDANVLITPEIYGSDARNNEYCLCAVDMNKSASASGYISSKKDPDGEYDPFDTHWYITESDNQ